MMSPDDFSLPSIREYLSISGSDPQSIIAKSMYGKIEN